MTEQQEQIRQGQGRRLTRASAVAAAALTPLAVWLLAELVLGVEVRSPDFGPEQPSEPVGPFRVVVTGMVVSAVGWGLLAGLERVTRHARAAWVAIAGLVLVASLGAPFGGEGITTANRVTLLLMHFAVGLVLIPGLYRTARPRRPHGSDGDATPDGRRQDARIDLPR